MAETDLDTVTRRPGSETGVFCTGDELRIDLRHLAVADRRRISAAVGFEEGVFKLVFWGVSVSTVGGALVPVVVLQKPGGSEPIHVSPLALVYAEDFDG